MAKLIKWLAILLVSAMIGLPSLAHAQPSSGINHVSACLERNPESPESGCLKVLVAICGRDAEPDVVTSCLTARRAEWMSAFDIERKALGQKFGSEVFIWLQRRLEVRFSALTGPCAINLKTLQPTNPGSNDSKVACGALWAALLWHEVLGSPGSAEALYAAFVADAQEIFVCVKEQGAAGRLNTCLGMHSQTCSEYIAQPRRCLQREGDLWVWIWTRVVSAYTPEAATKAADAFNTSMKTECTEAPSDVCKRDTSAAAALSVLPAPVK